MDRGSSGRFQELDVLRGAAALAVVLYHYAHHGTRYFSDYPFDFPYGRYGVQLFFVISGFVIYYTLERSRTLTDFAFSRFSRLYPSYWAVLLILLVGDEFVTAGRAWWAGYVVNASMLQKFIGYPDIDEVFWTLAVELAFYIIMAAIFFARLMRWIVPVTLLWLIVAALWSYVGYAVDTISGRIAGSYLILPHAPYFISGIMFYLIHSRGVQRAYVGMIALAWCVVILIGDFSDAWISALIFGLVALAVSGRLGFMVTRTTLWLGAISYPLYLVHRNLGYPGLNWFNAHHLAPLPALAFVFACALLLAHLVSVMVERPVMRTLRDWYRRKPRPERSPMKETRHDGSAETI